MPQFIVPAITFFANALEELTQTVQGLGSLTPETLTALGELVPRVEGLESTQASSTAAVSALESASANQATVCVYRGGLFSPGRLSYASNVWSDFFAAVTVGTWADEQQANLTRQGSGITAALAGYYNVSWYAPAYSAGQCPLWGMRVLVNGAPTLSSVAYGGNATGLANHGRIDQVLALAAGDVLTFEYCAAVGVEEFEITDGQIGGANVKFATLDILRVIPG
jgi:hypothetical protein